MNPAENKHVLLHWINLSLLAVATRPISGTESSVHCVLLEGTGLLSTSVCLHLKTTIGHHEAPQWPQNPPKGIVANLVLFTETWS